MRLNANRNVKDRSESKVGAGRPHPVHSRLSGEPASTSAAIEIPCVGRDDSRTKND